MKTPVKTAEPYYQSAAHRAWRAEVIRRAGGCCQGCGRVGGRLFADHVVELSDGGDATDPANGRALCGACHSAKTAASRRDRHQT
jgi:5-methylcytosine-specific restriction enzyme A